MLGLNSRFGGFNSRFKDLAAGLGLLTAALGVDLTAVLAAVFCFQPTRG